MVRSIIFLQAVILEKFINTLRVSGVINNLNMCKYLFTLKKRVKSTRDKIYR